MWEPIEGNGCAFGWQARVIDPSPVPDACGRSAEVVVAMDEALRVFTWYESSEERYVRYRQYDAGSWGAGVVLNGYSSPAAYGTIASGTLDIEHGGQTPATTFDFAAPGAGAVSQLFGPTPVGLAANSVPMGFTSDGGLLGMTVSGGNTTEMWVGTTKRDAHPNRTTQRLAIGVPHYGNADSIVTTSTRLRRRVSSAASVAYGSRANAVSDTDTPRLDGWKLTYRTDKSPSWGFDVEVADMCMTSVTNSSDIEHRDTGNHDLEQHERRLDNMNTADLVVALELESNVVSPGDYIYGEAEISNAGPGTARDVYFSMEPPDGCEFSYADFNADIDLDLDYFDYDFDYIEAQFYEVPFTDGEPGRDNLLRSAKSTRRRPTLMAINTAVESPTIELNAGNDAAAQTAVIGNYPNLWGHPRGSARAAW